MAKRRKNRANVEYQLYERDADLTARACAKSLNFANQHDWRAALDTAQGLIEQIEAPGALGGISPRGISGHCYLHFSGPFPIAVYERLFLQEGDELHVVLDDFSLLYEAQGQALRRLGRYDEAVAAYRAAHAWNPLSASASLGLVHALCEARSRDEARSVAIEGLAMSLTLVDSAQFYAELALDAQRRGDDPLARALVTLALALDPAAQAAYDLAVYYEYLTGTDRMELANPAEAVLLAQEHGLLLAPDQRFHRIALELADGAEAAGNFGRAAYYMRCAMAIAPDERLISRMDALYRKAMEAGQRTDGFDGFMGSGTFVTPANPASAVQGAPAAYAEFQAAKEPPASDALPAGHDHRSDVMSVRGNGEAPNAMGGIPGVAFPGQPLPYDGSARGAFGHRPQGRL